MPHGHPSSECEPSTSRNEDTDVDDRVTLSVRENQGFDHQLVLATAWFVLCDPSANDASVARCRYGRWNEQWMK